MAHSKEDRFQEGVTVGVSERSSSFPNEVPWSNLEDKRRLEAELRTRDQVAIVLPDGTYTRTARRNFIPENIFTLKWNQIPPPDVVNPFPADWSLVPNCQDRVGQESIDLMLGAKYAIEAEVAFMATVTEDGVQLTHVGVYQDMSDRDVSPAGKTWGKGQVAGIGPLWLSIDGWQDLENAQIVGLVEGIPSQGEAGKSATHRLEGFPANCSKMSRHWGKDLEDVLCNHVVYKDLHLQPGTRIMFTAGLLYDETVHGYDDRYFFTEKTPDINMSATLTLTDGRELQAITKARSTVRVENPPTEDQSSAIALWSDSRSVNDPTPVAGLRVDQQLMSTFESNRQNQNTVGKLKTLVTPRAFCAGCCPNPEQIQQTLPTQDELLAHLNIIRESWPRGMEVDLTVVRNGNTFSQAKGELDGIVLDQNGSPIDDAISKRGAQRAYDVGGLFWQTQAPDLVICSEQSSSLATMEIALKTVGEPYPPTAIQRDWRLNERSFGTGIGHKVTEFSTDELYSFTRSLEGGENYTQVYLKTLSFFADVLRTATKFYQENGRPMRIVIGSHEGPIQVLTAALNSKSGLADVFQHIESTQTQTFRIKSPEDIQGFAVLGQHCQR